MHIPFWNPYCTIKHDLMLLNLSVHHFSGTNMSCIGGLHGLKPHSKVNGLLHIFCCFFCTCYVYNVVRAELSPHAEKWLPIFIVRKGAKWNSQSSSVHVLWRIFCINIYQQWVYANTITLGFLENENFLNEYCEAVAFRQVRIKCVWRCVNLQVKTIYLAKTCECNDVRSLVFP